MFAKSPYLFSLATVALALTALPTLAKGRAASQLSQNVGQAVDTVGSRPAVNSDFWAAEDALRRKIRTFADAPAKRKDKYVAMFYWTWHQGRNDTTQSVKNISDILRRYPEALKDYHHPAWGTRKPGSFFWEEPLLGYYQTTDRWVLRKHAEMLADAGIDAVFFDCTNGTLTWKDSYEALLATWTQAQADGVRTPKVAFFLPFGASADAHTSLRQLYRDVYKPGRYKNLWFMWKGKPCILAYPDMLDPNDATDREIASFFTFRAPQPDYVNGPFRNDQWGWLEVYPQHGYVKGTSKEGKAEYEEVPVGVSQNTSPERKGHCGAFNVKDSYGRSFSIRKGFDPRCEGYLYGWNFDEQWDRAFEIDPELVFVTGWNEYTAGMWLPKDSWNGVPFSFVDEFDWDHSRDIEPNKGWGDRGDVYYLQLVDKVRKFKGMSQPPVSSGQKSINLRNFSDWKDVSPYYATYKGNTMHRNARGYCDQYYVNNSGRNDIIGAKVARDRDYIYFYVETAEKLSAPDGPHWMQLFIDADRDKTTGWNGYDYVVNRVSPKGSKAVLEKNIQGIWMWQEAAKVKFYSHGSQLAIAIPRDCLGIGHGDINIEFKWNDNMQKEGDIMDFYVNGDTAPGGRFNYVYTTRQQLQ